MSPAKKFFLLTVATMDVRRGLADGADRLRSGLYVRFAQSVERKQRRCIRPVSLEAFAGTYSGLPGAMRAEIDGLLEQIRQSTRPLVLLLLFGLGTDDAFRTLYQRSIARIFAEHAAQLQGCSLVVKSHPARAAAGAPAR